MEHEPFISRVPCAVTPLLKCFHVWHRKLIYDYTAYVCVKQRLFTCHFVPNMLTFPSPPPEQNEDSKLQMHKIEISFTFVKY